jgi:hypothetical protein
VPFNRDAWEGRKPLVEPPNARPVVTGDIVWETGPDDTDGPLRGGMVVQTRVDRDTGERWLTVIEGHKSNGMFRIRSYELNASDVDPSKVTPKNPHRLHRAARQVFRALGEQQMAFVRGYDRWLLEVAAGLVDLAEETVAEESERLREQAS